MKAGVVGQEIRLVWYDWINVYSALKTVPARTEISQFEFSSLVDEEVLGLQVPVEHLPLVTVRQTS